MNGKGNKGPGAKRAAAAAQGGDGGLLSQSPFGPAAAPAATEAVSAGAASLATASSKRKRPPSPDPNEDAAKRPRVSSGESRAWPKAPEWARKQLTDRTQAQVTYYEAHRNDAPVVKRAHTARALDRADLSDSDSESVATDDEAQEYLANLRGIFSPAHRLPAEEVSRQKALAQQVHRELSGDGQLSQATALSVAQAQQLQPMSTIADNKIMRDAHRRARKTDKQKYPALRTEFGKQLPQAIQDRRAKLTSKSKHSGLDQRAREEFGDLYTGALELPPGESLTLRDGRRSFALHHNVNKAGKTGFPEGQLNPYNLTVMNDHRRDGGDRHALAHQISSATGKATYSTLHPDAALLLSTSASQPRLKPPKRGAPGSSSLKSTSPLLGAPQATAAARAATPSLTPAPSQSPSPSTGHGGKQGNTRD